MLQYSDAMLSPAVGDNRSLLCSACESYSIPSIPRAINTLASKETFLSFFSHVSAPTSSAFLSNALTSTPRARRSDGEEVDKMRDNSVSSVRDLVDKFEDPTNVMNGLVGVLTGDTQIPGISRSVSTGGIDSPLE